MSEFKLSGAELKAAIKLARRKELGFAFNPGKSDDEHFFALDRKKDGAFLGRIAKKEGVGKKVAFGRCTVDGKEMLLTCDQVVPGMARHLKKFLQNQKTALKIKVLDADGGLVEADGEDETEEAAQAAPSAAPATEPVDAKALTAALAARMKAVQPAIAAAPEAVTPRLQKAYETVLAAIKAQEFDAAETTMTQLEAALKQLAGRTTQKESTATDAKGLASAIKEISGQLGGFPADTAKKLGDALKTAAGELKAGDTEKAAATVARIQAALAGLTAQAEAAGEASDIKGSPLVIWREAKEGTDAGISALQNALKSHKHPEMQKIADLGLNGMTEGNQTAMMKALMDFDRAPADQRNAAAAAVMSQVEAYSSFIASNKYVDLCEQNPLGIAVSIKAPLGAALKQIRTMMQAAA